MYDESSQPSETSWSVNPLPNRPDYLSHLPAELLSKIFHLAHSSGGATSIAPLSKALLPFLHEVLYASVEIDTYSQLRNFCQTIRKVEERGEQVRTLDVKFGYRWKPMPFLVDEGEDPLNPSNDELLHLFRRLKSLRTLMLNGSTRIALLVLSPQVAGGCLPQLDELFLKSSFAGIDDPYHISLYNDLAFYRNLRLFSLVIERSASSIKPSSKPSHNPYFSFPPLDRLRLNGPTAASPGAPGLLASFGIVHHLEVLDDSCTSSSLLPLLNAFGNSDEAYALSLRSYEAPYDPILTTSLLRFTQLDRLELGGTSRISALQIEALVSGPKKHNALKCLTFDQTNAKMGTRIQEDANGVLCDWHPSGWGYYPDWVLPHFTETCSRSGLKKLLLVAQQDGVEVDGEAVEAIEVDEAFDRELEWLRKYAVEQFSP
ncbi:hypothetical protein JCM11251_004815 [Rhodosporidiobolus azoricus]